MAIHSIATTLTWRPLSSYLDITAYLISAESSAETSGNSDNGLAFGDDSDIRATIRVKATVPNASLWRHTPIRVTFQVGTDNLRRFTGVIISRKRSGDGTLTFEATGYKELIKTTKAYSPLLVQRPAATATTATSNEDVSDGLYRGGLINWGLWIAGGRPFEQLTDFPSAPFYYSCEQAIIAPEYAWLAGEDMWAELLKVARASGGQLYQDRSGVIHYRQPFADLASPSYTFADTLAGATDSLGVFGDIEEEDTSEQVATKLTCTFVPRILEHPQVVIDDTTPHLIQPSGVLAIDLEPRWPILRLDPVHTAAQPSDAFTVVDFAGVNVPRDGSTGYSVSMDIEAARISIRITNHTSRPVFVYRILLRGVPIVPGEQGVVSSGVGTIERALEDNVYVQSAEHAQRLADLALRFYGAGVPAITLSGCAFDTRRTVGEAVGLTAAALSMTAASCLVRSIKDGDTGATAEYELLPLADIPTRDDFFLVGTTNYVSQSKQLGY